MLYSLKNLLEELMQKYNMLDSIITHNVYICGNHVSTFNWKITVKYFLFKNGLCNKS
jgi:hypothetical protein